MVLKSEKFAKLIFSSVVVVVFLILVVELILRVTFGLPAGLFGFLHCSENALYPPSQVTEMTWGFMPYTVRSNSLGLRGEEFPFNKPDGSTRIIALGDSVTDGYFVENEATYPHYLQEFLRSKNKNIRVINAARGASSIDKQFTILREIGLPLDPDMVLLTFVTNDIAEIMNRSPEGILEDTFRESKDMEAMSWFFFSTALGEIWFDFYLRRRAKFYRTHEKEEKPTERKDRYKIEGGKEFANNVNIFRDRWSHLDGLVLKEPFPPQTAQGIYNYLFVLENMAHFCNENDVKMIFIYFPAYPQIYDKNTSMLMRDVLRRSCKKLGVPFADLTETFRLEGQNRALHLAPRDFHLNPGGNKVMALAIGKFLEEGGFLDTR